jgi:hypothetical protein
VRTLGYRFKDTVEIVSTRSARPNEPLPFRVVARKPKEALGDEDLLRSVEAIPRTDKAKANSTPTETGMPSSTAVNRSRKWLLPVVLMVIAVAATSLILSFRHRKVLTEKIRWFSPTL